MTGFHEVRFPTALAFGSGSGIERKTQITSLSSGYERRINAQALGKRRYLIGAGVKSLTQASELMSFFEARCGQLYGFRFKDFADFKTGLLSNPVTPTDQVIGTGDGVTKSFYLKKSYGIVQRPIEKPVSGTVKVAVGGVERSLGFSVDTTTGLVSFTTAPAVGALVTAGFEFDTPVRFDADRIDLTLESANSGRIAAVALIEIRI
jgi:uncharacterized protein (TIGR02217 family)